jgi:exopolyphosphatase / guanosine-5'-triphosphate,3'-diphosphate pyrophosphatase
MLKIAAIDVGSNAIRLTVGEVDDSWQVKPVENIRIPLRLGQDVFTSGLLGQSSINQLKEAFRRFKQVIEDAGVYRLRAVATSAMREASNSQAMAESIYRSTGIKLEIIDGGEEARLIHLAVSRALNLKDKRTLLVDIGGGSVEVTLAMGANIISTESFNMGAVRLLKIMEKENATGETFSRRLDDYTQSAGKQIASLIGKEKISICVGTGGNVVEIGRLRQKLLSPESDRVITSSELKQLIDLLGQMSPAEIARFYNLRPDRADVILAGAIILQTVALQAHVREIAIPNVGLKEGVLVDLAGELSRKPRSDLRQALLESAMLMGRKYQFDEPHALLTSRLARQLFLQSAPLHGLGDQALLLLEVGALLHDIGHFINTIDHDRHGYYLLKANHLVGLTRREQDIVANLVRYHRGKMLAQEDDGFSSLSPADRNLVLELSALLSLADALDVSHTGQVQQAELHQSGSSWRLNLPPDLTLEKWTIGKRKGLFQEVFDVKLQIG